MLMSSISISDDWVGRDERNETIFCMMNVSIPQHFINTFVLS